MNLMTNGHGKEVSEQLERDGMFLTLVKIDEKNYFPLKIVINGSKAKPYVTDEDLKFLKKRLPKGANLLKMDEAEKYIKKINKELGDISLPRLIHTEMLNIR